MKSLGIMLLAGWMIGNLPGDASAQTVGTQAPPSAETRAIQSTIAELTQAWTGARTQMLAAQDQVMQLQQELQKTKGQLAELQAKDAKAIMPSAATPTPPVQTK